MASSETAPKGTDAKSPAGNGEEQTIPSWINEDHFIDVLEESIDGFKKILTFDARLTGGAGENYSSIIVRVKVTVELKNGSQKDVAFMIKTFPQADQGAMIVNQLGLFPKEQAMYGTYLTEFEQMYRGEGNEVSFGPKFYKLKKDPGTEYVLLEDLSQRGFKNVNRVEGLDKEHIESVLRLIAQLHAASAVRYETKGDYEQSFMAGMHSATNRQFIETMRKSNHVPFIEGLEKHATTSKYVNKLKEMEDKLADLTIELSKVNPAEFNVIVHGDLWANNIMFNYDNEGKRTETIFVDFQISRYTSPVVDLFYFMFSSTKLELKVTQFDYFIKYYYDHLVENLTVLKYPKKLPTMKDLRLQLLKRSSWGIIILSGIMAAVLLDPTDNASIENFVGEEGKEFKRQLYGNPRFIKHLEILLPWMDTRGFLDI